MFLLSGERKGSEKKHKVRVKVLRCFLVYYFRKHIFVSFYGSYRTRLYKQTHLDEPPYSSKIQFIYVYSFAYMAIIKKTFYIAFMRKTVNIL